MWLTILGFLRKIDLRVLGIGAIAAALFVAGWTTNGWRYKAKIEAERAEIAKSYAKQHELFMAKYREQTDRDQAAAEALSADLERVRAERRDLEGKLRDAAVVKDYAEICTDGGSGNPFGPDFSRLWNGSGPAD
jgi:hypothetical protein